MSDALISARVDAPLRAWLELPLHDRLQALAEDASLMEYLREALVVLDAHREEFIYECGRQDVDDAQGCLQDFELEALND